jgi:hypothetical protein
MSDCHLTLVGVFRALNSSSVHKSFDQSSANREFFINLLTFIKTKARSEFIHLYIYYFY